MRPVRIIAVLTPTLGGLLLAGCSSHTFLSERPMRHHDAHARHVCSPCRDHHASRRARSCECQDTHGSERADVRWDVVLPPPEVARDERWFDPASNPEHARNDASLSPRSGEPIDAIGSSWPEPWRPDLEFDRTGRTSTNPERFIYSSSRAWWYTDRYGAHPHSRRRR